MMENAKRPTELQGGPVLIQELGLDFQDGSGPVGRLAHDGKTLLFKSLAVDEAYPDEVQAPVAVVPLPRIAYGSNVASRSGLQTLQNVALIDGDIVLLFGQTSGAQNGLWQLHANVDGTAQAWTRPKLPYVSGQLFAIQGGVFAGSLFRRTNVGEITEDTTAQTFEVVLTGSAGTTTPSGRLTTTDATVTTILTLDIEDNAAYRVTVEVLARQTNAANRAAYVREFLVYREAAGAATQEGSTLARVTDIESNAAWDVTVDVTGNTARVRVTGAVGATINWQADAVVRKVS